MCMETPLVVGDRRFPSGNPQGRTLPISPPGIPTGFCHDARGCAAEALPRVKSKDINNPNGVVPMVRMDGMCGVYGVDIGNTFLAASSSAPVNPIPFRPLISNPPAGLTGTTPCGVGNPMWPGPGDQVLATKHRALSRLARQLGRSIVPIPLKLEASPA